MPWIVASTCVPLADPTSYDTSERRVCRGACSMTFKTIIEPFRIKTVEPIRGRTRERT